jgi:hypothetical protein
MEGCGGRECGTKKIAADLSARVSDCGCLTAGFLVAGSWRASAGEHSPGAEAQLADAEVACLSGVDVFLISLALPLPPTLESPLLQPRQPSTSLGRELSGLL